MTNLIIVFVLLALGFIYGRRNESKHFKSIKERSFALEGLKTTNLKKVNGEVADSKFVIGSVVVSIDFFKAYWANIKSIFGGRLHAYENLVERAKLEAIVRLKEDADGFDEIYNLRIETSNTSSEGSKNNVVGVEVLAYGTAVKYKAPLI